MKPEGQNSGARETPIVRQRLGKRFRENAQQWKCWLSWWPRNRENELRVGSSLVKKKKEFVKRRLYACCSTVIFGMPACLYSCCSQLEHRASVKSFVSFQFLNLRQSLGLSGREISPSQGRYLHRTTQTQNKRRQTAIHALSGICTHDPSVRARKDISCLRTHIVIGYFLYSHP
jgi:hypothetical protein